jgi:uncharacterized membrane protein
LFPALAEIAQQSFLNLAHNAVRQENKKKKKNAQQLASEAAAALEESGKHAAAESEKMRAVQAAELVTQSALLQLATVHIPLCCELCVSITRYDRP